MSLNVNEIDINKELYEFIEGTDFGNKKYIPLVHRKIRLNSDIKPIKCPICWNEQSSEGILGCPSCDGVGYLWDESIIPGFMYVTVDRSMIKSLDIDREIGRMQTENFTLVTPSHVRIRSKDVISEIFMNSEGEPMIPIKKENSFLVTSSRNVRLDDARSQFRISYLQRAE